MKTVPEFVKCLQSVLDRLSGEFGVEKPKLVIAPTKEKTGGFPAAYSPKLRTMFVPAEMIEAVDLEAVVHEFKHQLQTVVEGRDIIKEIVEDMNKGIDYTATRPEVEAHEFATDYVTKLADKLGYVEARKILKLEVCEWS